MVMAVPIETTWDGHYYTSDERSHEYAGEDSGPPMKAGAALCDFWAGFICVVG